MPTPANPTALAQQARRSYVERLLGGIPAVVQAVDQGARTLAGSVAEPAVAMKRREIIPVLQTTFPLWQQGMTTLLRATLETGTVTQTRLGDLPVHAGGQRAGAKLSLVDDDTIEHEILSSRLALAMMDRASWEFTDLRSRMNVLEKREELDTNDILRPHVLARVVTNSWLAAPLGFDAWRLLQSVLHDEFSHFAEEAYHETNRFLLQRHVLPEVDLRPFIRRSNHGGAPAPAILGRSSGSTGGFGTPTGTAASGASDFQYSVMKEAKEPHEVGEETRMMTRASGLARSADQADAVLNRLNRVVGRQLPDFANTSQAHAASPRLSAAIAEAQEGVARRLATASAAAASAGAPVVGTPALLEELHQRKQALKAAATTPVERATIEIVALLFQSILMEDAIPATVRVWFARLQMPVLRVAVSEPDFFATVEHPARRLIDRMGSCVMGFDATSRVVGDILEKEIKRVVQVVEAYPDTGRRVFQTVLTEFEKFLEHYFKNENEASKKGVSLAAQVEQRETMAIQYTIELRKMLNDVPVQEGVRDFLFHVWADVLATTAVKAGNADATKEMKRVAADLIWSASAKVSRAERAEVIRRLPPLLKTLRDGMDEAGIPVPKQDEHIQRLNNSLAAAFTAKAAAISHERLEELMQRLETLEELLPEAEQVEIDESLVMDLSGHESSELEVVGEGGSMPTPAMLQWARELQVGSWYMLDYRNRNEAVQLAWQGMRKQLTLFVSPQGRGVLFQQHRLAAFLQAGLLVPA
ncbi:MAG TPA: DUF1631 family protein, partial [Caldimonas sp.]|nr:DUF1631 family protein [Caldimonas sp.]